MTEVNVTASVFPGSVNDPSKQREIYNYLEILKKDEFGWKKSAENIINNSLSNVEEHFLLLQVIEDYLAKRYSVLSDTESMNIVRRLLSHWIQKLLAVPEQPVYLVNKVAHIFSLVFAVDFPERWPNFINEIFLSQDFSNISIVLFYLKTLMAIDAEVVNRDIQRTQIKFDRNTKIKDYMRDICIKQMVNSWYKILVSISDTSVQSLCLEVVGAYIDWIDVELVANNEFLPLVIERLRNQNVCEAAVHAVTALMQKGMPTSKKCELVFALGTVLQENNLITITDDSDYEDVNRAGSLLNTIGLVLLDCQIKYRSEQCIQEATQCITVLESYIETILHVLNNTDPELSALVIDTVSKYAHLVRDDLSSERAALLNKIVKIALNRYIMNDDLEVDGEGEDELEFHEYRKELRSIINSVGTKRPDLVIAPLEESLSEIVDHNSSVPIRKLEAIAQLIYSLSELIPSNFIQQKEGWLKRAAQLPITLLENMVLDGRSSTVHVLYFEIACRYDKLLAAHAQPTVGIVAAAFLDNRGIAIPIQKVRTRIVYLFCRFVKAHKTILSPIVSNVIRLLAPLLAVSPQCDQFLSAEDQSFIFESTATLIIFGEMPVVQKSGFIQELATNLGTKFETAVAELELARQRCDANAVKLIEQFMVNVVGYSSRITKAFNNTVSMGNCQCTEIFIRLLNLFLGHLSQLNIFLLEPVRQLANRMVVCLDVEVLPLLPVLMDKLCSASATLDSMNQLLILTNQIIAKHKKASLQSGVNFKVILTTAASFSVAPESTNRTHEEVSALLYVRRGFMQLMNTVAANDMFIEIAGERIADLFEATIQLALGTDQSTQKLAMLTLSKISSLDESFYSRALRTALTVPSLAHISLSDAGSTLVVHEVSSLLQGLRQLNEEKFSAEVKALLPSLMASNLLKLLETMKSKELDKQIMILYLQVKT